jgi:nucleoside-diphosphate-sugar epimerase
MVDWIYIDDLVNGLVSMMTSPGIDGETVELGSGKVISVKDIVIKVTHMINEELDPVIGGVEDRPLEQEDLANISKTQSQIGWSPQYNLEKGLRNTIEHYKKLKL